LIGPDIRAPARRFEMDELGVRGEDDTFAVGAKLQAIVNIIVIDWEPHLVQAANGKVVVSSRDHTSRGYGTAFVGDAQEIA